MVDLFDAIKKGDATKLRELLASGANPNQPRSDGLLPLHLAVQQGQLELLEIILKQMNLQIDGQDNEGNTAIHYACKNSDAETVKVLVAFGANANIINKSNKKPIDLAKDTDVKSILAERMVASNNNGRSLQQARSDMIQQIEAELPNDVPNLKQFTIELLLANQLFQDRVKETIHQLIEEKHIAVHKYRLLENAAGIRDNEQGNTFVAQLQYLQLENEQQAATIAYLKIQNRMLESSITQQEDYYRKNLSDMTDQHGQEIKIMMDRVQETELRFLEVQKQISEEMMNLRKENQDLRTKVASSKGGGAAPSGDVQFLYSLQNENHMLQQKIKDSNTEKVALMERLKSTEQLKSLHEQEIARVRNDMNLLRKVMQEAMAKVLTEARNEADEKDEDSGAILFVRGENGSKQIKGATVEKLVERLTDPGTFDSQFLAAFMLTFRSFMDCTTFLNLLIKRYKESVVSESSPSISAIQSAQSPIQLRVCNTLKYWIENYWFDYEDKTHLDRLLEFVEFLRTNNEKLANVVRTPLQRKMNGQDLRENVTVDKKAVTQPRPKPLIPKAIAKRTSNAAVDIDNKSTASLNTLKGDRPNSITNWGGFNFGKLRINEDRSEDIRLKLMDLEPLETARQLTLIEYELFTAIKPTEFLDQAWMKDDKEIRAPNICNMTKWSNHVTRWTVTEIVTLKDNVKNRAMHMERFILLAQHLEKMNNFNGVKEVLAGLQSSSVHRLKKTREAVGSKYLKIFDDLVRLTSSDLNFKTLRSKIHASDPPLIPFPGVYQGDLVFLDTCSRSKLENGLVNFLKYQKIASYILELQVYQQTQYNFEPVPEIGDYIRNFHVLNDDEAYNDSLVCEPRQ